MAQQLRLSAFGRPVSNIRLERLAFRVAEVRQQASSMAPDDLDAALAGLQHDLLELTQPVPS